MTMSGNFGILIYDHVQPIDVIGPWDVFNMLEEIIKPPLKLYLISEDGSPVTGDNRITLMPHTNFKDCPKLDYLLVPGGRGRIQAATNEKLIEFIKLQARHCQYVLSVCTGMFLLYRAGLLTDHVVTTYWRALPVLKSYQDIRVVEARVVKSGKIWTSGGVSSGIDLALAFIAELAGKDIAGQVQLLFEYFPRETLYASLSTPHVLPPYYASDDGETPLPQYIKKYIQSRS